jgi:hypothetical protein
MLLGPRRPTRAWLVGDETATVDAHLMKRVNPEAFARVIASVGRAELEGTE